MYSEVCKNIRVSKYKIIIILCKIVAYNGYIITDIKAIANVSQSRSKKSNVEDGLP